MTPEEVNKAYAKLTRYNSSFDPNVDQYCPPLVRIKNGNIAKRQPPVRQMRADYWKSQCSFRGLKTAGGVEELKDRIRSRDRSRDIPIKQELDQVQALLDAHREQKEKEDAERWWLDPSVKLELKVQSDAQRALKALLDRDPGIRNSVLVIQATTDTLTYWAEQFGLACGIVEPAQSMLTGRNDWLSWNAWSVIGRADLVRQQVEKINNQAKTEALAAKMRADAAMEARRVEQRNREAALLEEAKSLNDWDLTGSWVVKCTELATYSGGSERPERVTMEIYNDDFDLDDVRGSDEQSEDEYDEYEEIERQPRAPAAAGNKNNTNIPRYSATFHFGVVEGVTRIYSSASSRSNITPFKVNTNPSFEYIWRGRDTGTSEIQTTADEKVLDITFGTHGTTFEGTFDCEFLQQVKISGRKVSHGHGRKMRSEEKWRSMSEREWNRECTSRWG